MTNTRDTKAEFVKQASRSARTGRTLRLQQLMEATQKAEIADRIVQLRERSPFTQENIAGKLGLTTRAYQKVEARGTESWERCEELARIHREWAAVDPEWSHLSAGWIYDGRERTPDVIAALSPNGAGTPERLDRLQDQVEQTLALVTTLTAKVDALDGLLRERLPRETQRRRGRGGQG